MIANIHVGELTVVTIIDAGRTAYYFLNSAVTEQNLTKYLHNVQKLLLINCLQSKLQCSNSFQNASVPNVGRSSKIATN